MSIKAFRAFRDSAKDIERLMALHAHVGGSAPGRRYGLEVLNKSAIVLITAIWEAFCEDLASDALRHIVANAKTADVLSKRLKQTVASELKKNPHQLAVWELSGDGWRRLMERRLDERNRKLNTPKSDQIDGLFREAIGLERVSDSWKWTKTSAAAARTKLDHYIELRGSIAHRGKAATTCRRKQVSDYFMHVRRLVGKTLGHVTDFVQRATGSQWDRWGLMDFAEAYHPQPIFRRRGRKTKRARRGRAS